MSHAGHLGIKAQALPLGKGRGLAILMQDHKEVVVLCDVSAWALEPEKIDLKLSI